MILTTRPIPLDVVAKIRELIQDDARATCWFNLSLNSGLRGGDILRLQMSDIRTVDGLIELTVREEKTGKIRTILLNETTSADVQKWISKRQGKTDYLIEGSRGKMNTNVWSQLLKHWASSVGYKEPRTSTHSCRKTWVKTHYERGTKLNVLMKMLNHNSEIQTLTYCGIMETDIKQVYADVI